MVGAVCGVNIPNFIYLTGNSLFYIYEFHCIFVVLLPLAIIIFFTVHLIRSLQLAQRSRMVMTSRSSSDGNNITIVMIVIIIVFFVCQAPIIVVFSTATFVELTVLLRLYKGFVLFCEHANYDNELISQLRHLRRLQTAVPEPTLYVVWWCLWLSLATPPRQSAKRCLN